MLYPNCPISSSSNHAAAHGHVILKWLQPYEIHAIVFSLLKVRHSAQITTNTSMMATFEEAVEQTSKQHARKRSRTPNNWAKNVAKEEGYKCKAPPRIACHHASGKCEAATLSKEDINSFQAKFYSEMSKVMQDSFLVSAMQVTKVKRSRGEKNVHSRNFSVNYFVRTEDGEQVKVCSACSILQVHSKRVSRLAAYYFKHGTAREERRGGFRENIRLDQLRKLICSHIESFKCASSHYGREKTPHRKYLPSTLCVRKMWKLFLEEHPESQCKYYLYLNVFNGNFNLGFGTPRTDVCSYCEERNTQLKVEEDEERKKVLVCELLVHKRRANAFYNLLNTELNETTACFAFDMMQNQPLPRVAVSEAFYSRQLWQYYLGIIRHHGPKSTQSKQDVTLLERESAPKGQHRSGSLGNSRLTLSSRDTVLASKSTLNLVDASIQVDLTLDIIAYDSDDDIMGRKKLSSARSKKGTPVYSREDIREQYCITSKEVNAIESSHSRRLFGCIPNQDWKSCNRGLLLPSCVRKSKISSDENLAVNDNEKLQKVKMVAPSGLEVEADVGDVDEMPIEVAAKDDDYEAGFYRRSKSVCAADIKRYTYPEADMNLSRMVRSRPKSEVIPTGSTQGSELSLPVEGTTPYRQAARPTQLNLRPQDGGSLSSDMLSVESQEFLRRTPVTLPNTPDFNTVMFRRQTKTPETFYEERRQKHVSFDSASLIRSQTAVSSLEESQLTSILSPPCSKRLSSPEKHKSQERLLDIGVRRSFDLIDKKLGSIRSLDVVSTTGLTPVVNQSLIVAKIRKPMKTQATQTEISFAGKVLLPAYLTLSPRAAGYSLECAEIEIDSPPKTKKFLKTTPEKESEVRKESDLHVRLLGVERSSHVSPQYITDNIRKKTKNEKEIFVNFEPHRVSTDRPLTIQNSLIKTPTDSNVLLRQETRSQAISRLKEHFITKDFSAQKDKSISESESTIAEKETLNFEQIKDDKQYELGREMADKSEGFPRSISKEVVNRTDSEDSNQSLRKRLTGLRENSSGTPSGESHKSESGSQYYSLTDHSSLTGTPEPKPVKTMKTTTPKIKSIPQTDEKKKETVTETSSSLEQQSRIVKFRSEKSSKESLHPLQLDDEEVERWSGSEKSATSSSLEMDRTVAYSSDTEFGSVKSEDSHTLIDPLHEDDIGFGLTESDGIFPVEETMIYSGDDSQIKHKLATKDSLTSPESESSSSQFTERDSVKSDVFEKAPEIVVVYKGDLSRTDSNKSDVGSETSEDYMTATEYSDTLETLKKSIRRPASRAEQPGDDQRPATLEVTHLSLPRRKERLHITAGDMADSSSSPEATISAMKEISVIPEALRESVSSVATSPSIESSTSGSYTVDSGLSELELSRKLSTSTIGNSDNEQELFNNRMKVANDQVSKDETKRYSRYLEPNADQVSEEDTSVKSRVAKFESLQQKDLTSPTSDVSKTQTSQKEKHRVTLEIRLETDLLPKSESRRQKRQTWNKDKDEPLSESSVFQKKQAIHRSADKPEIPPKPVMKETQPSRRSRTPDAELFFASDRGSESPKSQRSDIRGQTPRSDTESTQSDETLIEVSRDEFEPPSRMESPDLESKPKLQKTPKEIRKERRLASKSEEIPVVKKEFRRSQSDNPEMQSGSGWTNQRTAETDKDKIGNGKKKKAAEDETIGTKLEKTRLGEAAPEETSRRDRRAFSESPEQHFRMRGERSHSFSRETYESRASMSPERGDGKPRKHDRKALEFRRTISDTSELLRIEKKRLLSRTPEKDFDFSEMAKVLCTHCGERLRQSIEAEHSEALAERFLSAEGSRSQEKEVSPRTSVSSSGPTARDVSSRRSSKDHDLSPSAAEIAEITSRDRLLLSSGPSSLESLLRRSPRDTPVFYDSPVASGSQASLRTDSSSHRTSVQDITHEEEEEETGVYAESYQSSVWIYIGESEEIMVWSLPQREKGNGADIDKSEEASQNGNALLRTESLESTMSEREFRRRYQAVTHRMVHRKSSLEMYRRVSNKTFESDKTVTVQRKSGEFGFRIHGSRPVVVSAIEPGTPAETSGLEVGDIIITVNGANVVEASHSEVVKIAHTGSDTLQLEVARTCHVLAPIITNPEKQKPVYAGFLYRLGGIPPKKWHRRWFVLKQDNCLYYFKSKEARDPLGAIALANHAVSRGGDAARPFTFKLTKYGSMSHFFAADDEEAMNCWIAFISQASTTAAVSDMWIELTTHNLSLPPLSIQYPDCHGYLMVLGPCWKSWRRRYCVLKDGCVYFYADLTVTTALGVVHFHGYKVQTSLISGKKYAFEAVPPEPKFRHYCFSSDNDTEKKRWLAAMEYSIDRWIKIG